MRFAWCLLAALTVVALAPAARAAERVALLLDPQDTACSSAITERLAAMRVKALDVHAKLADDKVALGRFAILVVGPHATRDPVTTDWMRRNAPELRTFVAGGGVVVLFDQEPDFWDVEPWLPADGLLLRGRRAPGRTARHEADHPLFRHPHAIDPGGLTSNPPEQASTWSAFRHAKGFLVLAEGHGGRPWCVETGWGSGRVLALAWSPPPAAPAEGGEASRQFLENVLTYALDGARGKAPALPAEARLAVVDESGQDGALYAPESEKDLGLRVNAAVDRGTAWLQGQQRPDGSWGEFGASNGTYRCGPTAIALLAILASGVSKHDKGIERGFAWLLQNPPDMTYEIGLSMMALEEKAAPARERFEIRRLPPKERRKFEYRRDLTDRERRFMADCRDRLVRRWVNGGTWCYRPGLGQGDISNGQYALLGLKAAARCGIEVDEKIWRKALDYFLTYQQPSGPKVTLPVFRKFDENHVPRFYAERTEARGWQYLYGHPGKVLGSHVCIGIASTIICYEELRRGRRRGGGASLATVRKAVRDGIAWLQEHWSVDHVPGADKHYYYYFIYSLERVGVLTQNRFLGDHDWYREGAEYLLAKQRDDGSWHSRTREWGTPIANSAFALLFLKRSTPPPVITLRK